MASPSTPSQLVHVETRQGRQFIFCANSHCQNIIRNTLVAVNKHFRTSPCDAPEEDISKLQTWLVTHNVIEPEDSKTFPVWFGEIRFDQPIDPFPFLPIWPTDYYGCTMCAFAVKAQNKMRHHYKSSHPDVEPVLRTTTVQGIQSGSCARYYQVTDSTDLPIAASTGSLLVRHLDDDAAETNVNVTSSTTRSEPNKWLEQQRFNIHLEGYDLTVMASLITRDYSTTLGHIIDHLRSMVWRSRELLAGAIDGHQLLKQLNRRKYSDLPQQSFHWDVTNETLNKYVNSWALVFEYAEKLHNWEYDFPPPCQLSDIQDTALVNALQLDWAHESQCKKDTAVFDLVWTIGSQELRRSSFVNVLTSTCAILAIDPRDASWRTGLTYESSHFSAFIKIFLFITFLRATAAVEDQGTNPGNLTWTSKYTSDTIIKQLYDLSYTFTTPFL